MSKAFENEVNKIAAEIVGKATFAFLDLSCTGYVGQHVGCAYDNWVGANREASSLLKDAVLNVLTSDDVLGYRW